ncbi:M24 family metallopeptidase [Methylovirgula sp. 4M-Z18]|uniref:M24 family metallopeptidase n=1 Tax=Methylovirgula sp. 4M-Z18 TaxID=2293567 RepID=UPI000E2F9A5B|nr:Xaa-Pro peptidase family protein [Methylovirgula sp. 4M-Z18]RFB80490.1 aminopeptidase P family protein [Methylovirgula sp. 4M-Z18]
MGNRHLDRQRAAKLMRELDVAGLVLVQPESILYATGAFAGVATLWRRAGAAAVLVPADPEAPLAAVVGDLQAASFRVASGIADTRSHPIWVETTHAAAGEESVSERIAAHDRQRPQGFQRPATFDSARMLAELRDILIERGLDKAPLGLELGFVAVADMQAFQDALPHVRWRDASPLVARLRMVKQPAEIEALRAAAKLTTAGLQHALGALREGIDAQTIGGLWRGEVEAEARRLALTQSVSHWAYIAVGADGFAPGGPAQRGDVVKIDVGAVVGGYSADVARTAVIGKASPAQRQIHGALLGALDAALASLAPGRPLKDAHAAATKAMHDAGFPSFSRGHFGHSLGASVFSEEWPFIAADCDVPLEPNMVIAVEAPYYVRGIGGFIIEDQFLVRENGLELMSPLARDLLEIG